VSKRNDVHPTAVIEGDVQLGERNVIGPFCHLRGPVIMGDDNQLTSHVCIGLPGQDTREPRYDDSDKRVVIGDRNTIREFTSVQKGCYEDFTYIGNDVFLMQSVHVPHDAHLEDHVVLTPMVAMAGLVRVLRGANLALGSGVLQHLVVGQYSIVAAGSMARKHVRPFTRSIPGKDDGVNHYAVQKFGFADHATDIAEYVLEGRTPQRGPVRDVIAEYEDAVRDRDHSRARPHRSGADGTGV
jgi:UDP-N-acetylglucosamine acyltransferase